jgi:hypothetical protein
MNFNDDLGYDRENEPPSPLEETPAGALLYILKGVWAWNQC